jgi:RND family efflux transporter MFP subunit
LVNDLQSRDSTWFPARSDSAKRLACSSHRRFDALPNRASPNDWYSQTEEVAVTGVTRTTPPAAVVLALIAALGSALVPPAAAQSRPGRGSNVLEFQGTVVSARTVEIAPSFDGLLDKIHFFPGQPVEKGALLFEFRPTEKELFVERGRAQLQRAEAQLRLADVTLKNKQTLHKRNVVSDQDVLEAEVARDIAAANAAEARTSLRMAELTLKEMKLFSPITGLISRSFVKEGAYLTKVVREESRMAQITQVDPIQVLGEAPFDVYFQIREVRKTDEQVIERLEFSLILPNGERFPHVGKIVAGGYEFNLETQKIEILLEFPNPDYLLRPGLTVTLQSPNKSDERTSPPR